MKGGALVTTNFSGCETKSDFFLYILAVAGIETRPRLFGCGGLLLELRLIFSSLIVSSLLKESRDKIKSMPLFRINTSHYLNRKRVFIDSDDKIVELSRTAYDTVYDLGELYEKVQSIELVNYNIPRSIVPTFVAERFTDDGLLVNGNNKLDILMTDFPVTISLQWTCTLAQSRFTDVTELAAYLQEALNDQMNALGDPFFNISNNVDWTVTANNNSGSSQFVGFNLEFRARQNGDETLITSEFLFGSGPNKDNAPWNVLGFEPGVDNGGYQDLTNGILTAVIYDPVPDRIATVTPYRYVDVLIEEAPELAPVARIFMTDRLNRYTTNRRVINRTRLLSANPIRKISTMRVKLVFEGGIVPPDEWDTGYDLTFDFVILSPEQTIPCWTQQEFVY